MISFTKKLRDEKDDEVESSYCWRESVKLIMKGIEMHRLRVSLKSLTFLFVIK